MEHRGAGGRGQNLFHQMTYYRHFSIYVVEVEMHKKNAESKDRVNRDYLVVLKRRKIQ